MATGAQKKRKELRDKRLAAEAAASSADKRQDLFKILGIAAFLVVVAVIIAIFALGGGDDDGGGGGDGQKQLAGLAQEGNLLGDPNAPVTLVEFGDLQCPICREFAEDVLPPVIKGPVKDGTANFEFENWAILGPDSQIAAKAAIAAGEQDRMWNFLEAFYANQGAERSGYVTDEFLTDVAEKAGVPDIDKFNETRSSPELDDQLIEIDSQAQEAGFGGTPAFALREADGSLTPLENYQTSDDIIDAINEAAAEAKKSGGAQKSGNNSANDE